MLTVLEHGCMAAMDKLAEGQQHTLGAYHRSWK